MNNTIHIELDNDLDNYIQQGNELILFRSGTLLEGEKPTTHDEIDSRIRHPFAVTITKDAELNTKSVKIDWVATEPDNADTIEIQIKNLYNF